MSTTRPKPIRQRLRLEQITFDSRLQLRAYPGDQWFDDAYVKLLTELHEQGAEFEPLEVVEEKRKGKESLFWLIDGFNRSECLRRRQAGLVECLVFAGTFADAQLWALASNAKHGKARTSEDCRKAFDRLMSSAVMVERVVNDRNRFQGTERALAAATGLSHGVIAKYLRERNLRVDRVSGKLVAADGPLSPERDARQALVAELDAEGKTPVEIAKALDIAPSTARKDIKATKKPNPVPEPQPDLARAGENSEPAQILARAGEPEPEPTAAAPEPATTPPAPATGISKRKAAAVARVLNDPNGSAPDVVADVQKELASVAKKVEGLLRSPAGDTLKRLAKVMGIPFEVAEADVLPLIPRQGDSLKKIVNVWPAFQTVQALFGQLAGELAVAEMSRGVGD